MSASPELDALRRSLQERGLRRADMAVEPMAQFRRWFDEVAGAGFHEPDAMVLSSVGADGVPSSRYVLLRGVDHGFVFFTNYDSRKGRELDTRPAAAICVPWHLLARQVRVTGVVERVSDAESDAYFAGRPRGSQLGAWASRQSEPIAGRHALEEQLAEVERRFEGVEVPRPPFWGGYRVVPREVEFWLSRPDRLHDRFRYTRAEQATVEDPGAAWSLDRLSP